MLKLPLNKKQAYYFNDSLTIEYLTGVKLSEGFLVYSASPVLFADARYFSAVKDDIKSKGFIARLYNGLDDVKAVIKSQRIKTLIINYDKITLSEYAELLDLGVKLIDGSRALKLVKAVKSQDELDKIKKACEITQKAFYSVLKEIKLGVTESYVKDRLEREMIELGADGVAFDTIVAFNENSAVPHHVTGQTQLKDNSVVLIDMGCKFKGYCSDITRTIFFGQPQEKFIDRYGAVLSANLKAIDEITDGTSTFCADKIARDKLKEKGLEQYFTHSLGHGVGSEIHEFPSLSPKRVDVLEDQMVFTIEPGVYFDGEYGIRIEDTVVLTNGKVERLFSDSKELIIIK